MTCCRGEKENSKKHFLWWNSLGKVITYRVTSGKWLCLPVGDRREGKTRWWNPAHLLSTEWPPLMSDKTAPAWQNKTWRHLRYKNGAKGGFSLWEDKWAFLEGNTSESFNVLLYVHWRWTLVCSNKKSLSTSSGWTDRGNRSRMKAFSRIPDWQWSKREILPWKK